MTQTPTKPPQQRASLKQVLQACRVEFAPERRRLFLTAVLASLTAILEVSLVFAITALGAAVIGDADGAPLDIGVEFSAKQLAGIALALVLLRGAIDFARVHVEIRLWRSYEIRARLEILHDYLWAEWAYQTEQNPGELVGSLVSYLSSGTRALRLLTTASGMLVSFVVMLIGSFLAGGQWVLAILVGTGVLALAFRPLTTHAHHAGIEAREAIKEYSGAFYQLVACSLENRVFAAQAAVEEQASKPTRRMVAANAAAARAASMLGSIYGTVVYVVAVIGLGALAFVGSDRAPAYAAVVLLLYRGLGYGRTLQGAHQDLVGNYPNFEALQRQRTDLRTARMSDAGADLEVRVDRIDFDDVHFTYPGGVMALRGVSFDIEKGEAVGLVGPSGAGKSTIVQVLMRLREPTAGRMLVNGSPADHVSLRSWYEHVVLVPQISYFFLGTILENVTCYRPWVTEEDAIDALTRAGVYEEFCSFPNGLSTAIGGDWGHRLSGGQRQRLIIARALASRPDVLIMDEPTSALDLPTEEFIRQTLERLKGETTLVIIAHRLSTLRICDRVIVMQDGRIDAIGDRESLQEGSGFYAEAVRLARLV